MDRRAAPWRGKRASDVPVLSKSLIGVCLLRGLIRVCMPFAMAICLLPGALRAYQQSETANGSTQQTTLMAKDSSCFGRVVGQVNFPGFVGLEVTMLQNL